jgi:hypothetical protein
VNHTGPIPVEILMSNGETKGAIVPKEYRYRPQEEGAFRAMEDQLDHELLCETGLLPLCVRLMEQQP